MHKRYIVIASILFLLFLYFTIDIYRNNRAIEVDIISPNFSQSRVGVPHNLKSADAYGVSVGLAEVFKLRGEDGFLEKLDDLVVRGIPGTPENIDELDQRFKVGSNSEEKIRLARLYNTAYYGTEDALLRNRISQTISDLLRAETDTTVGRALALSHSRMFIGDKTQENLEYAYKRNFLSSDDYYGELAHIVPRAVGPVRIKILNELAANHNQYASEIIADFINNSSGLSFSKEEAASLKGFIADSEPKFTGPSAGVGMIDVIRYEQWLKAITYLENTENSTSPGVVAFNRLTSANVDPRAAVALLISPYGKFLLEDQKNRAHMSEIKQRAEKYIAQYPSDSSLQQAGVYITQLFNGN